jgi:hypothetical protein
VTLVWLTTAQCLTIPGGQAPVKRNRFRLHPAETGSDAFELWHGRPIAYIEISGDSQEEDEEDEEDEEADGGRACQ